MHFIQQSFWNTLFTYCGIVLGYFNMVFLFPSILGLPLFGLTRLFIAIVAILVPLAAFGGAQLILRFAQFKYMVALAFGMSFFGSSLVSAALYFSPILDYLPNQSEQETLYYLILLNFVSVQTFLLSTYLRQGCKTVFTTFLREFFLRLLQTLLVVVYFYVPFDTHYFLPLFIGTFIIQALLLLMYSLANPLQKKEKTIEQPKTIEKVSYIVYNFLGTVAQAIMHHIDIVLIFLYTQNRVSQEEAFVQVSIYSVLKYMATLVIIPQRSIAEAAIPQMVRHLQGKSFTALEKLSRQTSLLQLIIATFIALALAINSKDIFTFVRVIRPEQLSMVQPVFLILLLLKIIKSKFETQNGLYVLSDLYRSDIILQCIFALISIFLGKYAVQKGGLLGIAASNLFIFISLQLLRDKIIQPHFTSQQKSLWSILLGILILGGILYLFFLTFDFPYAPWVNIILRTGLCAVIYGMSLVLLGGRCCGER